MRSVTPVQLLICGLVWLLAAGTLLPAQAQRTGQSSQPLQKPVDGDPPKHLALAGPAYVCVGAAVSFTATGPCNSWYWDTQTGAFSQTDDGESSTITVSWSTPGTYEVTVNTDCLNPDQATQTVVVVDTTPGTITTNGQASQVSATEATLCAGNTLQLVPPPGSANWSWNGANVTAVSSTGVATIKPVAETNYYTLNYTLSSAQCAITSTFLVKVSPLPDAVELVGADAPGGLWRLGEGNFTLTVKNADPAAVYNWYAGATPLASSTPSSYTTGTITAAASPYTISVGATTCQEGPRSEVTLLIRNMALQIVGATPAIPTGPVHLAPNGNLTLQVVLAPNQTAPTAYTWFRDGTLISNATGSLLNVTQAGTYQARIGYPNSLGPSYFTQDIKITAGLDGQVVNGQELTYLRDTQVLKAGVTTAEAVGQLATAERIQRLTYLTGWAQPLQQVSVQAGPAEADLLQTYGYVVSGASAAVTARSYLPFALATTTGSGRTPGRYETDPLTKLNAYYATVDGQPYGTALAEKSPLGRPFRQAQPGSVWAAHPASVSYGTNSTQDNVHRWQELSGTGLSGTDTYAAGQLTRQVLLDADGRRTELYQDGLGRTVLQRKVTGYGSDGQQNFDTYRVYAPAGYLRYVIPPAATQALAAGNWQVSSMPPGFAGKWLYQYTYDDKARLVERKFPGAAPVYLVYDQFDRPILVQDGTHRATQDWLFTKFDGRGRAVVSGIYHYANGSATLRQDLQQLADNFVSPTGYERRQAGGYSTDQTFPVIGANDKILSVSLFDDYDLDYDASHTADFSYQSQAVATQPVATTQVLGLPTITRSRVVLPGGQVGGWLMTVLFYDQYGNLVQKQSDNLLQQGGSGLGDVTTLVYREQGFVPQVLSSLKVQRTDVQSSFSPVVQVRNRFRYDAAGRLLQTWQQHQWKNQWEPEVLVSNNTYTGLGELTSKQLHSRDGVSFLQKVDLAYNLHGQLARINSSNGLLTSDNAVENDLFALTLYRETNPHGATPRYDGGISALDWASHNAAQTNQIERQRRYTFTYDGLGRLTEATSAARRAPWYGWTDDVGAYDEKNIGYDANGNITTLQRYTKTTESTAAFPIDDLTFTYATSAGASTGNQHDRISDAADATRGFKDATGTGTEYTYDDDGSITTDANKGVGYVYNMLNKVEKQTVGTQALVYYYDATGTLLRRDRQAGGASQQSEYYIDGLVYRFTMGYSGLVSIPTTEGRAVVTNPAANRLTYEYHLRDHLGNLRVAFRAQTDTENLRLSSEDASEEGEYPKFKNVLSTQSGVAGATCASAYPSATCGTKSAAVTNSLAGPSNSSAGPSIAIPVSHLDHLKLRVYYKTPADRQYGGGGPTQARSAVAPLLWEIAPTLLPTAPSPQGERPGRATPGVQLSLTGLLSRLTTPKNARQAPEGPTADVGPDGELQAYIRWTLLDANGSVLDTGTRLAQATTSSRTNWTKLDLPYDVNLSNADTRTGTLLIEEVNEGSQAVYFDSLTITHPKERALVSQENHYYPFGMALSGVAVNTVPVADLSKEQFNEGSMLQDELLGNENGVYSTPYRTYDPSIGRFTGVDPLANIYADLSTYHFSDNDPINFNDPTGAIFGNAYDGGRIMNPRGMDGQRHWAGSDLDLFMYETSGGIGSGGGAPDAETRMLMQQLATLMHGEYKNGRILVNRVIASGTNYTLDNEGNRINPEPWETREFVSLLINTTSNLHFSDSGYRDPNLAVPQPAGHTGPIATNPDAITTLRNSSSKPIALLPDNYWLLKDNQVFILPPGASTRLRLDGFTVPGHPKEVYKVATGVDLYGIEVTDSGFTRGFIWSPITAGAQAARGGWKGQSFVDSVPREEGRGRWQGLLNWAATQYGRAW